MMTSVQQASRVARHFRVPVRVGRLSIRTLLSLVATVWPAPTRRVSVERVKGLRVDLDSMPDHSAWVEAADETLSAREAGLLRHAVAYDRAHAESPARA